MVDKVFTPMIIGPKMKYPGNVGGKEVGMDGIDGERLRDVRMEKDGMGEIVGQR
jgi:hypothetical protein